MENLTTEEFKEKIFDYENESDWVFKGDKPTIIDFYADWCQPCKTLTPMLEELDEEYDEIQVFKVNTDEEVELAATFGIQSIPTMLFIPLNSQPQMANGLPPKENLKNVINELLLNNSSS